jgi:hypothetical protein
MFQRPKHLSDRLIVSYLAGELPAPNEAQASAHFASCQKCRTRRDELQSVLRDIQDSYAEQYSAAPCSQEDARRLLRARMAEAPVGVENTTAENEKWLTNGRKVAFAVAAACATLAIGILLGRGLQESSREAAIVHSIPDSHLTPGATLVLNRQDVCSAANVKNKPVPVVLQRKVFQEYGIPGAAPQAYEVDYLVTPALGGAEDIRNLWPQSFSADWNARVKDDLEDRLRDMVCSGELELTEAQREIARNWIVAYKKYFHTDRPLRTR